MDPARIPQAKAHSELNGIFQNPADAAFAYRDAPPESARGLFFRAHLPLLLTYPLAALACPYSWITRGGISIKYHILAPLIPVLGALLIAIIHDKILEYSRPPELHDPERYRRGSNLSLYLHLPLAAAGMFFIVHPGFGYLMLFVALAYSIPLSIVLNARVREISLARSITTYLNALSFPLIPIVLLALIYSLTSGWSVFQELKM